MCDIKSCFYCCGSHEEMTAHHEPPKLLFPKPLPQVMLTVPCCKKCHDIFLKDDEYLRTILVSSESVTSEKNAQAVNKKLLKAIKRTEARGMKKAIHKSLFLVDIKSPGGIYLGKSPAIKIDGKRFFRILKRIARGLFYIIHEHPLSNGYEVTCKFEDSYFSFPKNFIYQWKGVWMPPVRIGDNIFSYSYILCDDDPNGMLFVYWFYDKLWFYGMIAPKINDG